MRSIDFSHVFALLFFLPIFQPEVVVVGFHVAPSRQRGGTFRVPSSRVTARSATEGGTSPSSTPDPQARTKPKHHRQQQQQEKQRYRHTLAVLTLPVTSSDRIGNEAVLKTALAVTDESLSVVLRRRDDDDDDDYHSLAALRRYVGEVYSAAWDAQTDRGHYPPPKQSQQPQPPKQSPPLLDLVVYPQGLPNAAPESWLHHRPSLEGICSHDSMLGWRSIGSGEVAGSAVGTVGSGLGGLDAHVTAINADRRERGLAPVVAVHAEPWTDLPIPGVVFFEDDDDERYRRRRRAGDDGAWSSTPDNDGTTRTSMPATYHKVAVGGTFDGMHYGHRKLLTLAVSTLVPMSNAGAGGQLLVGVTSDAMLVSKTLAEYISPLDDRIVGVRRFLDTLAPGIKNQVQIVPIDDAYGPTLHDPSFEALIVSDEVLETGLRLNQLRTERGMQPMDLLCTRRTEPVGMSSTAMRQQRAQRQQRQ